MDDASWSAFFKPSKRNLLIKQHHVPSDHSISIISESAKNLFKNNRKKKELYDTLLIRNKPFSRYLNLDKKANLLYSSLQSFRCVVGIKSSLGLSRAMPCLASMFEIFLFRKLDLAMIAEEPSEAEKEKNDKNERQKTPPSDVPPRMDEYDRLNSSSSLKQCFFPWPKQLDQVSLLKPVSFVFVDVDENVATAIMRIVTECEKGSTVFCILVQSLYNSALSHLYNPSPQSVNKKHRPQSR